MLDWKREFPLIVTAAQEYGVDPYFIAAIRTAENGGPGREFGVLSECAAGYFGQLHACCATLRDRLAEFDGNPTTQKQQPGHKRIGYTDQFVEWFGSRWAPTQGAPNDPNRLNQNWLGNVLSAYQQYTERGYVGND